MYELGLLALARAVESGALRSDWELRGIGAVSGASAIDLGGGASLELRPRSDQDAYARLLAEHDVGLALMYTPHPSLVPIEMASAGMLTVTNTFENKTGDALRSISPNLIPVEPTIAGVADGIAQAVAQSTDHERRARGAAVDWSRDWADSLNDGLMTTRGGAARWRLRVGAPLAIEVRDLHKSFRLPVHRVDTLKERALHPFMRTEFSTLEALRGISFDVRKGEMLGIVGRNGSGKTTLLKLLASIYRADRGSIRVAGTLAPFIELGVGFNQNLTARDNVLLNGVMMGLTPTEARRRFDAVIEFAELEEFVELKLKNYSSGMAMRLAFSVMVQVGGRGHARSTRSSRLAMRPSRRSAPTRSKRCVPTAGPSSSSPTTWGACAPSVTRRS